VSTVYVRALKRAAQIVGGLEALGAQLDVPVDELAHWMDGSKRVPDDVFLRAVDIVSARDIADISGRHANLRAKGTASKD
jgi:hypothetical protein